MPQVLKEEVQRRIVESALRVFADKGYLTATMAEIAEGAGISTGNVYRYYDTKESLFDAALDPSTVERFKVLLQARVRALTGVSETPSGAAWISASEELMRFTIDNRLRVIVLLSRERARGSRLATHARETVDDLVRYALEYQEATAGAGGRERPTQTYQFVLEQIYENLIETTSRVLAEYDEEAAIREAIAHYTRYHLAGLRMLFGE